MREDEKRLHAKFWHQTVEIKWTYERKTAKMSRLLKSQLLNVERNIEIVVDCLCVCLKLLRVFFLGFLGGFKVPGPVQKLEEP